MLLLDENISHKSKELIASTFTGTTHVKEFFSPGATDIDIWQTAKENNLTIVTFDSDYEDLVNINGFPPKVIWLRFGNSKKGVIVSTLLFYKTTILDFIVDAEAGVLQINEAIY
jgi:predicted nuclease of predicted toxin-antitoxin system